jgi:small subunit ribosomal protein S4
VRRPSARSRSRPYPPGQHGRGRIKESEYLLQLREKQKARRIYGVLEKQFRGYYEEAVRKPGKTGENLLQILESPAGQRRLPRRLRPSRDMARQLVKHGHFLVNGKKVDIPSYRVTEHDIIEVRAEVAGDDPVRRRPRRGRRAPSRRGWRSSRADAHPGAPAAGAGAVIDTQVQEQLIVELYSK